jgi:hypothetical protein
MKVSKEFLKCYDAIFNHIFRKYGLDDLIEFWKAIAPVMLADLKEMAAKDGIIGCERYWKETLAAEGAGFRIHREDNKLHLEITNCSSISYLSPTVCPEYCRHCGVMYPEVLESVGLKYEWKRKGTGRCEILVEETK